MNYLSHHLTARHMFGVTASDALFAGNLLPDLLPISGDGRVRRIPAQSEVPEIWQDLAMGAQFHLDTDKRFHGHPAFIQLTQQTSKLFQSASFETPLRRVFFLAHVAVELALDGYALQVAPNVADDLYAYLSQYGSDTLARGTTILTGQPAPNLAASVNRFIEYGYLRSYRTLHGQTEALHRVSLRANLPGFDTSQDHQTAEAIFAELAPLVAKNAPALWGV